MNEFIKILLSLSVSGALLLLLILGLRSLYKNRFSKRWQYYIWIIVALRFLLPFTPDTTIVGSLFEKFDTAAITNEIPTSPNVPVPVGTGNDKAEPIWANQEITVSATRESFNKYVCLFFIWSALALVLFVRKVTVYQGFIQYIKAGNKEVSDIKILNLLSDCEEKLNIKTRVELSCNPLIDSPMLIGFFRPRIILPIGELEDKELFYIFVHEMIHYKQRDMFYKWLIQIVVCVHWFNPFIYLLEKEVNKSCELSCDEKVISVLDDTARREYGDTLISFLKSNNLYKSSLASVTLTEGAEQLKERLGAIMKFRKKSKAIIAITAIFTVAVCVCFFVTGAYAAPSVVNDMKTWDNSEILNEVLTEDGVYYIFCDGAREDDKPLSSVSAGSIKFVLVRKDSYTSVGPFGNMETLIEDVAKQCEYMNTLTQEEKQLLMKAAADIYGNVESDNKNSILEMELDRYYDDTDPFVNERLFCVSEDINTLKAKISFQMDGKSGIVEIRDNETDELIWANTWNGNIENDTFTILLNNILGENEYVIKFVGTEINYAKIKVAFESDLVQERERPRKSN
jgi:beta-lactamase regulating signal transducer with metallopeptidase domain